MSRNTPAEFKAPKPSTEYEIYMWDKFENEWIRYHNYDKLESTDECEAMINKHGTHPLSKHLQVPRDHWKIVRVSKACEVVDLTGGAQ